MLLKNGVYPTMITPFTRENQVDYIAVERIVSWYGKNGCSGIFAVCQSSEMFFLSLKERTELGRRVVEAAKPYGMQVVVSGHISDDPAAQAEELCAMAETGTDALVLVSNRLDLHNDGDGVWLKNAESLVKRLPPDIPLGIYECPKPYKRLLSDRILQWCAETGRFVFIKDTCCDPELLQQRLMLLKDTNLQLFNANAQTLLYTLKYGASGYSGVMANFHPDLYVWLCRHFREQPEKAERLQELLTMYAFEETMHYPVTAKYHMNLEGIPMELDSRSADKKDFISYERMIVEQGYRFEEYLRSSGEYNCGQDVPRL